MTCRICKAPLFTRGDQRLGVCSDCYPLHKSPSCKSNHCTFTYLKGDR